MTATVIEKTGHNPLLATPSDARLTAQGQEWLSTPEDLRTEDVLTYGNDSADLILSTCGIFR